MLRVLDHWSAALDPTAGTLEALDLPAGTSREVWAQGDDPGGLVTLYTRPSIAQPWSPLWSGTIGNLSGGGPIAIPDTARHIRGSYQANLGALPLALLFRGIPSC